MKVKEQETVDKLFELFSKIRQENDNFKTQVMEEVNAINTKVEKKFSPIALEQNILSTVQQSIQAAIEQSLMKYDSPLTKLITIVVDEHSQQLKQIISDSFDDVIQKEEFKESIRDGFAHKIARTIINNNDGLFEKVSNELKQDAIFKSKMALAVANVVNECLDEKLKTKGKDL